MRKVRVTLMVLAILVAITGIVSASENLLQNGGFETGSFSAWDTSLNLYNTLPEWSTPEIVTSPVYSGNYSAYFECKDQQYYNWWPGSGHVDQARQTIPNVDYSKLQNMVFDVWTKYTGGYSTWVHAGSLGSVDFVVYDDSNNPLSRYVIRHTSAPNYINYGAMQLSGVPGCFRTYTSGSGWTHSVVDIGSELVDSPTCGIPAEKQGDVDHVDVVIYTFSYGFGNGDAKIYVDDLAVIFTQDTTPPSIAITNLEDKAVLTSPEITITGTASDNVDVSKVEVSINDGSFVLASGTTEWSFSTTLEKGSNTITVRATDNAGNTATTTISAGYVSIEDYKPYYHFSSGEDYYPTSFYFDNDADVSNNRENYDARTGAWNRYYNYVHTVEDKDYFTIQYWLYYTYNYHTIWRKHEHDWDSVIFVVFDKDNVDEPVEVRYARHNFIIPYWWDEIDRSDTHPIAYVANGSHGAYPTAHQAQTRNFDSWSSRWLLPSSF